MQFSTRLEEATLIRRYKRFLADIVCDDGRELTIHCPNSGSMRSCSDPGSRICYSTSDNPKRKYPQTLEMVQVNGSWVGVNTSLTNRVVAAALKDGIIAEFQSFDDLRQEVKTSDGTRLDLLLTTAEKKIYIEIKNCSLAENGVALFPDAVTSRGTKHLKELIHLVEQGHTGVIFYLVQRLDANRFEPAAEIDPLYARTLVEAHDRGVMVLVYQAEVSPRAIDITGSLPCVLPVIDSG